MTNNSSVPAGWYPDPLGLPQMRWWDNHAWTEHLSDQRTPLVEQPTVIVVKPTLAWSDEVTEATGADDGGTHDSAATRRSLRELRAPAASTQQDAGESHEHAAESGDTNDADASAERVITDLAAAAWGTVAKALYLAAQSSVPTVAVITSPQFPHLIVDTLDRSYWWDRSLDEFAADAEQIGVRELPRLADNIPPYAGRDLDPLLWEIGHVAFSDRLAPWLTRDGRYRLRRWPNVTALSHDSEQLRMISILSHAPLTASELAGIAETELSRSQGMLSALGLMGLLRRLPSREDVPAQPPAPIQPAPRGLFGRLRARLGI